jgi:hypothetical protein
MILDKELLFSKDAAVKSTGPSEVIDFKAGGDAVGQELTVRAVVTETFTSLTSLQIKLQTSEDKSAWEDVIMTPAIPVAKLTAGKEALCIRTPKGLGRYARLNYVVSGTGTGTAGKITAFMSKEL